MGWYLRKSVRMGPVRWNLSKSGIGMSVGVRGLRVGAGPRGPYVAGGRGGIYFRQGLGTQRKRAPLPQRQQTHLGPFGPIPLTHAPSQTSAPDPFAPMECIPETQLAEFSPSTANALAQYIAAQRRHVALFPWALGVIIFLNLVILVNIWPVAIVTVPLSIFGGIYIFRWDRQRTDVLLQYELDADEAIRYHQLCSGLAALSATHRLLRVEARQVHGDWKHRAGTTTALRLAPVNVIPPGKLPWLETNIPVWSIRWREGKVALTFLPDRVVIEQGRRIAVTPYSELHITTTVGRFVEQGSVPQDARILGYNWQYPNKDGGPDRRFNNNRQWPVSEVYY